MQVRGVPFHEVNRIIDSVSRSLYDGNVIPDRFARDLRTRKGGFAGRIIVTSSKGLGARRSSSGRRGPWACWHVFRDVFVALFDAYPDAVVVTAFARYEGRDGFYANYPATARRNAGSLACPSEFADLCECGGNVPETYAENRARFERGFAARCAAIFGGQSYAGEDSDGFGEPGSDAATFTAADAEFLDGIGLTTREG